MKSTRDHHVHGLPPNWSHVGQGFRPLTYGGRHHPMAVRRVRGNAAGRPAPRVRFPRVRAWWQRLRDRIAWLPANQEDRDAVMFAWGQLYMLGVGVGVWLLIHFV